MIRPPNQFIDIMIIFIMVRQRASARQLLGFLRICRLQYLVTLLMYLLSCMSRCWGGK